MRAQVDHVVDSLLKVQLLNEDAIGESSTKTNDKGSMKVVNSKGVKKGMREFLFP